MKKTFCEGGVGLLFVDLLDILSFTVVDTADFHGYHTKGLFTLFIILVACLEKERGRDKKHI